MELMLPCTGNYTGLSTAELPDDPCVASGHSTGMDLHDILQRIETRLSVVGLSADAASKAAGKPGIMAQTHQI